MEFANASERLAHYVDAARTERDAQRASPLAAAQMAFKAWQSQRLANMHADLRASDRYGPAVEFFLAELYAPKDFGRRDAELARVLPVMTRFLPEKALDTLADAAQMDALSESLDVAMVEAVERDVGVRALNGAAYGRAWRKVGRHDDRALQVELVGRIGAALDHLTRVPLIGATLRMMRGPAHMAGLAELQHFLESGFAAFKHMGRADDFLTRILARETDYMESLFAGGDG